MAGRTFHAQFNSPAKIYSTENISNAINKQSEKLSNGALGIDFHRLSKPGHLVNSEVLKMLEEEEINQYQQKGFKRVAWPPPAAPEELEETPAIIAEPPPIYCEAPSYTHAKTAPQQPQQQRTWENQVGSRPPTLGTSPATPTSPPLALTRTYLPNKPVEPPPTTITLRAAPPIQQEPPPIFESQPAATHLQGGVRMRGDTKWPPAAVKEQAVVENEARLALARGPAMRPRRVKRDYTQFFAQNALNSNYPSYRAPPGTQHYIEEGTSQL